MTTAAQRNNRFIACQRVSEAINPIKAELMRQVSGLDQHGIVAPAKALDKIIAQLERWQAVHSR